jgi:hypothetical protein
VWSVNGIEGGNAVVGFVSPTGVYTAPASLPAPAVVVIRATSVACVGLFAERRLHILESPLLFITGASVRYGMPVLGTLPPDVVNHGGSVRFGTPTLGSLPPDVVHDAASTQRGVPALAALPPDVVLHGASASLGPPPVGAAGDTIVHGASVSLAPVIVSLGVDTVARGTQILLTLEGFNLHGAVELEFHRTTGADGTIAASGVAVNAAGTALTADVSVSGASPVGARVVVVRTGVGRSTYAPTDGNTLTVE